MQKALAEEGFAITTEEIEKLSPTMQARIESWLQGDRVLPRFLVPYYRDQEVSISAFTDGEEWLTSNLVEEISDTFSLLGLSVPSPNSMFEEVFGFTEREAIEAGDWTLSIRLESTRAAEENRDPQYIPCPACVDRLLAPASPATPAVASPPDAPPSPTPTSETREQAIARLQTSLHDVRQHYLDRRDNYETASEAAKGAKKAMEAAQETLNELVGELDEAINNETWQARLPLTYDAPSEIPADDPAKSASVENLVAHGISQKQAEKLIEADIETIGELERRIREVNGWFRKVKGIGESVADKIADAIVSWRDAHGYGGVD